MKKSKIEPQNTFSCFNEDKANEITELGRKYLKEIQVLIEEHRNNMLPEERQYIIDLGEQFKHEDDAERWWGETKLDEKKWLIKRYVDYIDAKSVEEISKSDIIQLYEIDYGD